MHTVYTNDCSNLTAISLHGFFVGWQNPPSPEKLLELLQQSDYRILAKDAEKVIGFITAISDGVLSAYIPFLEVLPEYQGKGVGTELASQMLNQLKKYYMIDLLCDEDIQPFYKTLGMSKATGMMLRNYSNQSGKENHS